MHRADTSFGDAPVGVRWSGSSSSADGPWLAPAGVHCPPLSENGPGRDNDARLRGKPTHRFELAPTVGPSKDVSLCTPCGENPGTPLDPLT